MGPVAELVLDRVGVIAPLLDEAMASAILQAEKRAYVEPADRTAGYILRVVHTLVPGAFGKSTLCDLDLIIPRGGRIDVGDLAFSGSDGEEDLFLFGLPSDAEEDMA